MRSERGRSTNNRTRKSHLVHFLLLLPDMEEEEVEVLVIRIQISKSGYIR